MHKRALAHMQWHACNRSSKSIRRAAADVPIDDSNDDDRPIGKAAAASRSVAAAESDDDKPIVASRYTHSHRFYNHMYAHGGTAHRRIFPVCGLRSVDKLPLRISGPHPF